ncbi:MAG: ATP-grasp domain-containing protein [Gammaproteobacteria bacterium]|nr:ATP-grasp domain-containing protein [Gammaproteobacteria bacterium]
MFRRLLIANRGEIACRVIRTARRLGIHTIAVYSDADAPALHVAMADEAVLIGAAPPGESYLDADRVLDAARRTGAEAIHPGYGFLSENAAFCRACAVAGISFVGPPPEAIEAMGSKAAAKRIMGEADVPLVPGYHGDDQDPGTLRAAADDIGYPVLLKAVAGGGGIGMRRVDAADEFDSALAAAKRASAAAFGNDAMLVEKCMLRPRHVEVQVFCDGSGGAVHLFERDCSVQRRHQKVIEEAPAPGVSDALREELGAAAVRAARAIGYVGAGTVEFLLDEHGRFYFMEMNTRLQVEHPVTEMITGQDLVEWQLRVAAGEALPLAQSELTITGHAFEARIYAEDPAEDFLPATGQLTFLEPPAESRHVRIDTGVRQGDAVTVHYDPMIAKLIVWDETRARALSRLARALADYRVAGLTTNVEFLYRLAAAPPFAAAELDTGFIERHASLLFPGEAERGAGDLTLAALVVLMDRQRRAQADASAGDPHSPWNQADGWRLNAAPAFTLRLRVDGDAVAVPVEVIDGAARFRVQIDGHWIAASATLDGTTMLADIDGHRQRVTVVAHDELFSVFTASGALTCAIDRPDLGEADGDAGAGGFIAPMNGRVVALLAAAGARVEKGEPLMVLEAMKMEHVVGAPEAGRVVEFFYQPGDLVDGGATLLDFEVAVDS